MFFSAKQQSLFKTEGKFRIFFIANSYELGDFKILKKNHIIFARPVLHTRWSPYRLLTSEDILAGICTSEDILAHLCPFLASSPIGRHISECVRQDVWKNFFFKNFKSPNSQESSIKKIANFPLVLKRDGHFAQKDKIWCRRKFGG